MTVAPARAVRSRGVRALVSTAAMVLAASALVACGSDDSDESSMSGSEVTLLIRDQSLRVEGTPCAGIIPIQYMHKGSEVEIRDPEGRVVAEGTLPEGLAIPGTDLDFGDRAAVTPTNCKMDFRVSAEVNPDDNLRMFIEGAGSDDKGILLQRDPASDAIVALFPPEEPSYTPSATPEPTAADASDVPTTEDGS